MPAKLTQQDFIAKSIAVHGSVYSYEKSTYTTNSAKVVITCPNHGDFEQRASNHLLGRGCPSCKAESTSTRQKHSADDFIRKAEQVHGKIYGYSKVDYIKADQKVEIVCPEHGPFHQTPNNHLSKKSGCPKCAGKGLSTEEFIHRLRQTHGDRYSYESTIYNGIKNKITVICNAHGPFQQIAEGHMVGGGCPACWAEAYSSKAEKEIADWIESLGEEIVRCDRSTLENFEVDILIKRAKIGIEFNGRYWHSDRIKKNHRHHEYKTTAAAKAGIRLITIWDFDWELRRNIIKSIILTALGRNEAPKINARQCEITLISNQAANAFYAKNHIQGPCRGSMLNLALIHNNAIVACMSFTRGATRRGKKDEWELARYATAANVRGGASKLFQHFVKTREPNVVWSFSDRQSFGGGLYKTLGFAVDAELPADYRIAHPRTFTTWHKSLWQRKNIKRRIKELGASEPFDHETDIRTERQMQDTLGVLRVWDSGKIRWVWGHSIT